jgi:hypothetical protein
MTDNPTTRGNLMRFGFSERIQLTMYSSCKMVSLKMKSILVLYVFCASANVPYRKPIFWLLFIFSRSNVQAACHKIWRGWGVMEGRGGRVGGRGGGFT